MSESKNPKAGGLWARLFGVHEPDEANDDATRSQEEPPSAAPVPGPTDIPASPEKNGSRETIETREPAAEITPTMDKTALPASLVVPSEHEERVSETDESIAPVELPSVSTDDLGVPVEILSGWIETHPSPGEPAPEVESAEELLPVIEPPATPALCLACGAVRQANQTYCADCGWMFPENGAATWSPALDSVSSVRDTEMTGASNMPLQNRFELGGLISERHGVRRHRGIDLATGQTVVIVAERQAELSLPMAEVATVLEDDIIPGFDDEILVATAVGNGPGTWPSIAWEKEILAKANHPALPSVLDHFTLGDTEYLVLEVPSGLSLWDAWDEPHADASVRYGWLQNIAAALEGLHRAGAIYEGIRPDVIAIVDNGQPRITDVQDLLPFPLPPNAPIRATLYSAPELILSPTSADARADLYSFGAMLYSLEYLHHPLEEKDFERQFTPLQITERFPDVHPMFLRLVNKTFTRELGMRFPSDEMTKTDPTGFKELAKTLETCRRNFDNVRLDIAAWTTTGMVRTGNEDAFSVLHGTDARMDDLHEYAMVILCDGIGGYEAGEVAADMAINEIRKFLLQQPMFAALTGKPGPKEPVDPKKYQEVLKEALRLANRHIYTFSRAPGKAKRMMGCTAECVYVDSRDVICSHVGDSRVYHLHKGRLIQLTRDHTLVNRLVELGQLTAEEAENHPRKNELQQAIGGQPDVMPGLYHGKLQRGDWVLVCSDGLTNHITNAELEKMLTREAANSAEEAARRLLNLANLRGATDNTTIVLVRAS